MLGYRKHAFRRAHALLRAIELDREDLVSVKSLQLLLVEEIKRAERRVRQLKSEARGLEHIGDGRRLKSLEQRIGEAQSVIFIWKCFGDGIAFLYLDKYALKHTYLQATGLNAKQTSGFLLGKSGFDAEWRLLESALAHNVPAVLADLTNTIRHGDLCLLGGSDPVLIEVKSSKTTSKRVKRQQQDLNILHEFYENDHSDRLRGMSNIRREEIAQPDVIYADELNAAIERCLLEDVGISRPETGLMYIALRTKAGMIDEALGMVDLEAPWMFSLNGARMEREWAPYYPFTLMIRDVDHLWAFVRGDIFLLTLVSIRQIEAIASSDGNSAKFDPEDETYRLKVTFPDGGEMFIASQALARIGMECVSPERLITNSLAGWQQNMARINETVGANTAVGNAMVPRPFQKYLGAPSTD